MKYKWIENINEFNDIARFWDESLLASKEDNPFLLSNFICTWWKHYSNGLRLRIFLVYKDNNIVGGLPLCEKNGYMEYPGRWAANYTEFLSIDKNINRQAVWDKFLEALKERKDWKRIYLSRYRLDRLNFYQPNTKQDPVHKGLLFYTSKSEHTYMLEIPDDFSKYIYRLPKTMRYYIRRSEKEFSKLGEIKLCSLKDGGEIDALIDKYIKLSIDSFKRRNKKSSFEDSKYCNFFKELIYGYFKVGYLDANILKLNNKVIAIHFGYSLGNNLNYVFPVFDMDFAQLNPGHLLIYKLVELGSKRGDNLFDLYTGGHLYKEQWSDYKKDVMSVEIRPDTLGSRVKSVANKLINSPLVVKKVKGIIGSSDRLINFGRKVKKLFGNNI